MIDTDDSRAARVVLEKKIPIDQQAIRSIFDDNRDYALDYAKAFGDY